MAKNVEIDTVRSTPFCGCVPRAGGRSRSEAAASMADQPCENTQDQPAFSTTSAEQLNPGSVIRFGQRLWRLNSAKKRLNSAIDVSEPVLHIKLR
jgi:hypothetical protein